MKVSEVYHESPEEFRSSATEGFESAFDAKFSKDGKLIFAGHLFFAFFKAAQVSFAQRPLNPFKSCGIGYFRHICLSFEYFYNFF